MISYKLVYLKIRLIVAFQKYSYLVFLLLTMNITMIIANPIEKQEVSNKMCNYINSFVMINKALKEINDKDSEKYKNGFLLEKIIDDLSKMNLDDIKDRQEYKKIRQKWLEGNLEVIKFLDLYYKADTSIVTPASKVLPPEIDGVSYPFPIDPKEIKDPKKRAEYTQAIAENKKNITDAQLQIILKRLTGNDPTLDPKASYIEELKKKIPIYYSEYTEDKEEYKTIIEQSSLTPEREKEFSEVL